MRNPAKNPTSKRVETPEQAQARRDRQNAAYARKQAAKQGRTPLRPRELLEIGLKGYESRSLEEMERDFLELSRELGFDPTEVMDDCNLTDDELEKLRNELTNDLEQKSRSQKESK